MNNTVVHALAVGLGSAAGGLLRWGVSVWLNPLWLGFPLGTLAVNLIGGLAIGASVAVFDRTHVEWLRLLIVPGLLGGLTTFSAFSGESLVLLQRGHLLLALGHTLLHVVGALVCAALGFAAARAALGS